MNDITSPDLVRIARNAYWEVHHFQTGKNGGYFPQTEILGQILKDNFHEWEPHLPLIKPFPYAELARVALHYTSDINYFQHIMKLQQDTMLGMEETIKLKPKIERLKEFLKLVAEECQRR